jgi:hypothetical protein
MMEFVRRFTQKKIFFFSISSHWLGGAYDITRWMIRRSSSYYNYFWYLRIYIVYFYNIFITQIIMRNAPFLVQNSIYHVNMGGGGIRLVGSRSSSNSSVPLHSTFTSNGSFLYWFYLLKLFNFTRTMFPPFVVNVFFQV